ncbi:hypothetical protein DAPPUDRAFT_250621 [Daphnia pulex]|uniref:Uncharacterized protein n=1 Tax=Daphnia pulex TaxID=6669 RepID=E9GYZ3_DAPPU|nr:hypothetical protein DAPPUDRAFT_250621 [Daphnia pulex]|eukprot:EFX75321.1 hypothetical protein DAPPUDRAFT_250621 [Daphnia pulex]
MSVVGHKWHACDAYFFWKFYQPPTNKTAEFTWWRTKEEEEDEEDEEREDEKVEVGGAEGVDQDQESSTEEKEKARPSMTV